MSMGTNCAPLVAYLFRFVSFFFFFCYEWDFMKCLSRKNQTNIIEALNSTSRYLGDLLNIDNIYFDQMVDRIYPTELQLNKANSPGAPFVCVCVGGGGGGGGWVCVYLEVQFSAKVCDKRGALGFGVVGFPFLGGGVPRRAWCGLNISQLIGFARASSDLDGSGCCNVALAAGLLGQGCRCFRLCRAFSRFHCRHSALVDKYDVSHFCGGVCQNQTFAVTWFADLEELWESLAYRGGSGDRL